MKELTVEQDGTLKEFTDNRYAQGSFYWNYLIKNREIKVNGKKVGTNVPLAAGDRVAYYLTPAQERKPAFYTVYEDDNLLVADKESGVNSEAVFSALKERGDYRFIHRLDRNTKGLLLFAKTDEAEDALLTAFRERRVEKIYHALCFGEFPKTADVIAAYLKKDGEQALVRVYGEPRAGAEKIVTEYRVLKRTGAFTKAEITLHTGKTHQIRAHLAHIGCPVVGDEKYGDTKKNAEYRLTRQVLVAKALRLELSGKLSYLNGKRFVSRFEGEL